MSNTCPLAPSNKKEYISDIGKILVADFGEKKYYKPEEVQTAHQKSKWYDGVNVPELPDFSWSMSIFSSRSDFEAHHQETGEMYDYVEMKTEMLSELSTTPTMDLTEVVNLDMDTSWLDFGGIFETIFTGIGEVIGGILGGL